MAGLSRLGGLSEFMRYLVECAKNGEERIRPLNELSKDMGVSVALLREQMEAARTLGLIEARPRTGIRRLPYSFRPAVSQSLAYGIAVDVSLFETYSDLRSHVEAAYWQQAVSLLTPDDHLYLQDLVRRAEEKLGAEPVQIPHVEHRELHMCMYRRLNNPFVIGLLEVYWELYEAVGLNVYTDYRYLEQVWSYHRRIVELICAGEHQSGFISFSEHLALLSQRPQSLKSGR